MQFPGVTPPISTAFPTEFETSVTKQLVETLQTWNQYETEEEAQKREVVLGRLDRIFKDFVKNISLKRNLPESIAAESGGKIFTFGSYRLGVHGRGSDIDTLCVAPKHVQRDDFFAEMYEILKQRPEVTEVTCVTDAFVPVLKFEFSGIQIDLVCARLSLPSIPDDLDLADDNLLKNLDERCVRSLNGSRVTDEILRLVPNVDSFRTALRCIKLWAKQRAIYANVTGFFGGVAWAIVVARVCQLYPNASPGVIVNKFFHIMLKWNWPQPVLLKPIEEGPLQVRVWNPRIYPQDKAHRMPVITPAYPSMCSTHNVTASTQHVTTEEFRRGSEITEKIFLNTATWNDLFEKDDFFHRYKYYLQVIASTDSPERHLRWSGLVESRLRQLVMKLENVENLQVAHPFIKSFERKCQCRTEKEGIDAAHGVYPKEEPHAETGETAAENGVIKTVYTSTFYIGLQIAPFTANAPRKLDLTWPTQEFVKLVKLWEQYDQSTMGIVVQNIKRQECSSLPPELVSDRDQTKTAKKRPKSIRNSGGHERISKRLKSEDTAADMATSAAATTFDEAVKTQPLFEALDEDPAEAVAQPDAIISEKPETDNVPEAISVESPVAAKDPSITPHYAGLSSGFAPSTGQNIKIKLGARQSLSNESNGR
ncbi:polynucleotide adenylyltransferase [Dinochytrium kinnereticum]|nr:polynucleotide adenylyltransferase [Dinochytrium kinnereticum]